MNVSGLLASFALLEPYRSLREDLRSGASPSPVGLLRAACAPLLAALAGDLQRPMLVIVGTVERAKAIAQSLRDWSPDPERVVSFPEALALYYERVPWTDEVVAGRLQVISALMSLPTSYPLIVVSSARALMQRTLPVQQFRTSVREFHAGQTLDLEQALGHWAGLGYEPVSVVEAPGQFSHRGGILDVFPPSDPLPVRIELFGSQIVICYCLSMKVMPPFKVMIIRLRTVGGSLPEGEAIVPSELDLEGINNLERNLIHEGEHIVEFTVKELRPDHVAG